MLTAALLMTSSHSSGADNCVLSECPNHRSPCWTDTQAFTLASADVITLLQREHVAYALFLDHWAAAAAAPLKSQNAFSAPPPPPPPSQRSAEYRATAVHHRAEAEALKATLNEKLWRADLQYHVAWNVTSQVPIEARTYVIAFPLWAGLVNASQATAIAATLDMPDMLSSVG